MIITTSNQEPDDFIANFCQRKLFQSFARKKKNRQYATEDNYIGTKKCHFKASLGKRGTCNIEDDYNDRGYELFLMFWLCYLILFFVSF